ncbi:MAG: hypothetical protein JWR67_2028 [Mucilaginibacter sp.]|nr:hypothetical protein [Mucilaginibacter sp.]
MISNCNYLQQTSFIANYTTLYNIIQHFNIIKMATKMKE